MKNNHVKQLFISTDQASQRIDNFLMRYLGKVPKSRIYQMIRKGEVRVNKGRIKHTYKLLAGDCIRIPPVFTQNKEIFAATSEQKQRLLKAIIYEDEAMLVLNKPSGMTVHSGSGQRQGIIEIIRQSRPDYGVLELVHRLDRETSGCLMLAKSRNSLLQLHRDQKTGSIEKYYIALLAGQLKQALRRVDQALQKNARQAEPQRIRISHDGKEAVSLFQPRKLFQQATLCKITLLTGRTHQIRVHSAHIGHPVLGDSKYGNKSQNMSFRKLGLSRMFLHASQLQFISPDTQKRQSVKAPIDKQLQSLLDRLT